MSRFGELIKPYLPCVDGRKIAYGLGCAYLLDWREPDYDKGLDTLQAAWAEGFRYFDTAPRYCRGESEKVLGMFLSSVPRSDLYLATKVSVGKNDGLDQEGLKVSLDRSLSLLGTDYLDLYQLHGPRDLEPLLRRGVVDLLLRLKEEGVIRAIGLNGDRPEVLDRGMKLDVFDTILTYNRATPVDCHALPLMRQAAGMGLGIINATPLGSGGILSGKDPRHIHIHDQEPFLTRQELAVDLYDLCRREGLPLLALALQYPLRNRNIDLTLTGPADRGMVHSTLEALSLPLSDDVWARLDAWIEETADRRTQTGEEWRDWL